MDLDSRLKKSRVEIFLYEDPDPGIQKKIGSGSRDPKKIGSGSAPLLAYVHA